jgi:predicted DNA-binding antitoxin AbrB/MazE fold protein
VIGPKKNATAKARQGPKRYNSLIRNENRKTRGVIAVSITVDAIYQNGVLKPAESLPFRENDKVRLTIENCSELVRTSYGIIGWKGDHETLQRLLAEAEDQQ